MKFKLMQWSKWLLAVAILVAGMMALFGPVVTGEQVAQADSPANEATILVEDQIVAQAVQRPLEDFLSTQGTFCIGEEPNCLLFVPPDPNMVGWGSSLDETPVLFSLADYAGLTDAYFPRQAPEIKGTVTERPLADGRAEVSVRLHTKNANIWVIEIDLNNPDFLGQFANNPSLFGHRPADVAAGEGQALADTFLHVVFVNTEPGADLPDLVQLVNGLGESGQELKFLAFQASAKGPLTEEFGVPEGTPGKAKITQVGLTNPGQGLGGLAYPVENIKLKVVGR